MNQSTPSHEHFSAALPNGFATGNQYDRGAHEAGYELFIHYGHIIHKNWAANGWYQRGSF
jgi:hypothetical protein